MNTEMEQTVDNTAAEMEQVVDDTAAEMEQVVDNTASEMEQAFANKKCRGYTRKLDIWKMDSAERICVSFDKFGQPVGDESRELGQYIGTIVRIGENVSIEYPDWRKVPMQKKEDMYKLVKVYLLKFLYKYQLIKLTCIC
jgi:hypothetical protein